jgi:hypothetical protein
MASKGGRVFAAAVTLLSALAVFAVVNPAPVEASHLDQGIVVSDNPVDNTPYVMDGHVTAITTVGNRVIVGGTFTTVRNVGVPVDLTRNYIFAYDAATGQIDPDFVPQLDAEVETLAAAPDGTSVFVGGVFSTVDGVSNFGLTKLDVSTGQMVPGFHATTAGRVRDIGISGNKLYMGGDIWSVNGVPRSRMAAVDVTTGAVDPTFTVGTTAPRVSVDWVSELAISPDGSEMTIVGNFSEVDNQPRAQVAVIDLTGPTARLADWSTDEYDATCSSSFWTYVRDVEYSPDGSYFVIVTTGGPNYPTLCDAASRWESGERGSNLSETWTDWTGGDTLTAVAISDVAVYVGGHQRWLNDYLGHDSAAPGAVSRPGLGALDPINGVPLSWNPGKDRGVAVWDLHLSNNGMYVGSDTDFTAGEYHPRLAQFPLTGGTPVPVPTAATLPTDLFAGEGSALTVETFDGVSAGTPVTVPGNVIDWGSVNGAFYQAGRLYWIDTSGDLQSRPFDGAAMGTARTEPSWFDWSGATSAAWWDGKLYYTLSGSSRLRYRYFSLESGIVGNREYVVSGNGDGLDWSNTRGMTAAEGKLYYTTSSGDMYSIELTGDSPVPGTQTLISGPAAGDGRDWANADIFLLSIDSPPSVAITAPSDGAVVAGDVSIAADASDDGAVARVEFTVDGAPVGTDSDGSDGWSVTWDSTAVADGSATVEATAYDGGGQQATDSISVTVDNLGPTTTLTAPVDGVTISGTVTVSATVTDDVGVAQAEFFVDGASIGVDTNGGDGWSVDWDTTGTTDGPVTVSAVGSDTFGRTSSDQVAVTVSNNSAGVVVFVVSDPAALQSGEDAIVTQLEGLGYAVSVVDDGAVTAQTASGSALVIISSSVNANLVNAKLADATEPIWVAKPWLLDDMGMTGTVANTDYGTVLDDTVTVADPGHPLAAGYTGDVTVTTWNRTMSFGVPGPGADVVGTTAGEPTLFVYPAGATLANGSTAVGCRIHYSIFADAPVRFSTDGWALFDNVVAYAANGCEAPPVDNPPSATVTSPADGATVSGVTTVTADASDDVAVTQVEFLADGTSIGVDTDGGDGWSVDWDTTTGPDGQTSLTAVATDTADQTGSGSVSVTVDNQGPQVTITSPPDGATVHDVTTITADTGADPTVTQVEFFADGVSLGVDSDGSDGWSWDWDTTAVADGQVAVSATATDTMSRTVSDAIGVTVDNAAAGIITMVVGDATNLAAGDVAVRDRMEGAGYTVVVVDDSAATAADAVGASLVFLASSVDANVVRATFAGVSAPVWVAKPWLLDDMGMTGTAAGTDYGSTTAAVLTILDDTNPMAAGLSGDVVAGTSNKTWSFGVPAGESTVVVTANGLPTSFVYRSGALLADGATPAPGCRLHVSAYYTAVLSWNADVWSLFDAAVDYAAGGCQ